MKDVMSWLRLYLINSKINIMKEKAKMKISNVQTKIQIIYKIFLIIKKGKNVY